MVAILYKNYTLYNVLICSFVIVLLLIMVYLWVAYNYRYSEERISAKVLEKYQMLNKTTNQQDMHIVNKIIIEGNKVTAYISTVDKETHTPISFSEYAVLMTDDCSAQDPKCIKI